MKTKEELQELKKEVEILNKKLSELSEEELKQVCGGAEERTVLGGVCGNNTLGIFPGISEFPWLIKRICFKKWKQKKN